MNPFQVFWMKYGIYINALLIVVGGSFLWAAIYLTVIELVETLWP